MMNDELLQRDCGESLQRLVGGGDHDADGLKGRDAEQGLAPGVTEDDTAGGDLAHELNLDEAKGVLADRAVGKLVDGPADATDADALQLIRRCLEA
jgi:hypothetical protein